MKEFDIVKVLSIMPDDFLEEKVEIGEEGFVSRVYEDGTVNVIFEREIIPYYGKPRQIAGCFREYELQIVKAFDPDDVDMYENAPRPFFDNDLVELIKDRKEYAERDIHKGMRGVIMLPERNGYELVQFFVPEDKDAEMIDYMYGVFHDDIVLIEPAIPWELDYLRSRHPKKN